MPFPLVSSYLPPIALSFLGIHALFRIKLPAATAPVHSTPGLTLKDVLPSISQPRKPFLYHYALGCMAAFSAFGMFSLFAAMAPSFMAQMLPWHGPAVSGLSIGVILFLSAGIQLIARPYPTKRLIIIGFFALAATNALLVLNLFAGSPWLFALSVLSMSCGHALCNLSGMAVVNKVSKPVNRTGLLSTYLVVGYVGTIVPILGMGWLSDHIGLRGALIAFCACLGLLSTLLGLISTRARVLPVPRQ
ncbi:hypothetical protein LZ683_24745 [Comamonas testosteroni]|nr:hypothetical protein [Comamonas testosteroni]WEE77308.1 hypothetical protein LZ683_24745 [Comamonas testosteroni]